MDLKRTISAMVEKGSLNHNSREFYHRYGVQLIDAAYEAHEEKGEVPVMITNKNRTRIVNPLFSFR